MMVCSYDDTRLLLVLQIDHSRVAGRLAAHWGNDDFAPLKPYSSMVLAAQEHDSGWWDWEIKPTLNEQGHPPDYIGSLKSIGPIWLDFQQRGVERVADRDPYAGYIVSMHISGLLNQGLGLLPYMPDQSGDPRVGSYLDGQEQFRQGLLQSMYRSNWAEEEISEDHLWTNFKMMEVFDQSAQFICNRYPFNSTERKNGPTNALSGTPVPTKAGQPDVSMTVDVQSENHAVVRPYPFEVDPMVISFPGKLVPKGPYVSQEEFLSEFYKAEQLMISYSLCSE